MIRLQIFAGGQVERDESFSASEVTIGRTNANRLCLPANGVSARHCVIRRLGAGFELEDLASTNGTYVNRRRVRGRVLVGPQDEIIVATFTIRIVELSLHRKDDPGLAVVDKTQQQRPAAAAAATKGRAPKTFEPPLLPASEDEHSPAASAEESGSDLQWPEPLPTVSQAPPPSSSAASGSFRLGPVEEVDPEAEAAFRQLDPLAQGWHEQGRPKHLLMDPDSLGPAQRWLSRPDARPMPQPLHREFVAASLSVTERSRTRWVWIPLGLTAAMALAYGVSKMALNDDLKLDLPEDVREVIPSVASGTAQDLSVAALEPWLDKDPDAAVLASVAKLKSMGEQQDAESWAWESFLRKALRRTGGTVLAKVKGPATSMVMLGRTGGWAVATQDGSVTLARSGLDARAHSFRAHQGAVRGLFAGKDGRWLYSWGEDRALKRWDLQAKTPESGGLDLTGLPSAPVAVALSEDGRVLAAAGEQGTVRVWPVAQADPNGKAKNFGTSQSPVTALLWDQQHLFVGDRKGAISSWSAEGQRERGVVKVGEGIAQMYMTPDHKAMVVRGQEKHSFRIKRKGARWGKITGLGEIAASGILALDKKGRFAISVASEGEILMWDPQSPDPARVSVVITGPGSPIETLALDSRDQRMVAADKSGALWSWELAPKDGRIVPKPLHAGSGSATTTMLRFDERLSRWLVARSDGTIRAIDLEAFVKADLSFVGRGHRGRVRSVSVDRSGKRVLSGGDDQRVRLWKLGAGGRLELERELTGHRTPVTAVVFGPRGMYAYAAAQDGSILAWNLQQPQADPVRSSFHSAEIYDMLVTQDGKWLISVGGDAKVLAFSLRDGTLGRPKPLSGHKQAIFTLASDPKSKFSVSGGQDRGVVVWDLSEGLDDAAGWRLDGHDKAVWAVAVSPDLKWIASAGEDRRIHVHRVDSLAKREPPAFVLRGHEATVNALAFSPDGRWLVSGGGDRDILAWDLSAARPEERPLRLSGHAQGIRALQFVAPGRLVSASRDGALRLWNLHLEDASAELLGHSAAIEDQVIARAGAVVLTGSQDKTLRSWPIGRKELLDAACQRVSGELPPELAKRLPPGSQGTIPCADGA